MRFLVTPICNDENAMLNYEHTMTNMPLSVLKHQLSVIIGYRNIRIPFSKMGSAFVIL